MSDSISTTRRVEYALGFIALELLAEAAEELAAVASTDRHLPGVLAVGMELHMAAKHWKRVVQMAAELAAQRPQEERSWICWAYALRELQRTTEAREVLLKAEPMHGKDSAVLHYNLACYASLLGDFREAKARLSRAYRLDPDCKETAVADPDLDPYWAHLAAGKD